MRVLPGASASRKTLFHFCHSDRSEESAAFGIAKMQIPCAKKRRSE
jgi:hypothetical protein